MVGERVFESVRGSISIKDQGTLYEADDIGNIQWQDFQSDWAFKQDISK